MYHHNFHCHSCSVVDSETCNFLTHSDQFIVMQISFNCQRHSWSDLPNLIALIKHVCGREMLMVLKWGQELLMSSFSHTESKDPTLVIAIIHGEPTCNSLYHHTLPHLQRRKQIYRQWYPQHHNFSLASSLLLTTLVTSSSEALVSVRMHAVLLHTFLLPPFLPSTFL